LYIKTQARLKMENPQAQMPQGQPGPAPEQMQQGQPQQGGQDPQMQQIMQLVQQMMQQGVQPVEAAAELLSKQVPPEVIMQVFVQMGMPEQEAQMAIQQAMEGGQQQQGPGEEQMEGQASAPQEEMAEQGAPAPDQGGQPSPAEEIQMRYGGRMPRRLRSYAEGGDNQEMQAVMQQVQDMMQKGADARQVMEQIQAAAQQGQISPEIATSVIEQLSGMQQATNPQGDDATMTAQSQDPQQMDPNMAAPEAQMMKFGGNLKKLMSRAYGGPAVAPGTDSKTYAKDRTSMFVGAVKNSAFKSTLDDEFPSLSGNQMAYGGDLPKASNGIIMKDGKLTIDPTQFKSEAEYKAAALDWNMDPANKDNQVTGELLKTNAWKAPEPTYESGKNYQYDPATKQFKAVDVNQNQGYNYGYGAINPVAYQNPMNQGLYGNLYAGASPFARMMSGIGTNNMYDPRITGANLPGGMNPTQFLGAIGGVDKLASGMTGTVGDQTWRLGQAEKFKEGSIWKGNRRKGVRYTIDWGTAGAMNPAGPQNNPAATTTNPAATTTTNPPATKPQGSLSTMTPTGGSGMGAMERMDEDPFSVTATVDNSAPANTSTSSTTTTAPPANTSNSQVSTKTGGSGMGMLNEGDDFLSTNEPAVTTNNPVVTANQTVVSPGQSNVIQTSTEVDPALQNMAGKAGFTNPTGDFVGNIDQAQPASTASTVSSPNSSAGYFPNEEDEFMYPSMKSYGGNINPNDLKNAIALINRAFGGMIPRANNGLDLGSEDADGNGIPDYLQASSLPANQPNPFNKTGTIEQSAGKKLDINWNQVAGAAGDMYMNAASKVTNFANKMNAMNPERDAARFSALNRSSNTYDTMKQGLYDQAGNFIPNDIGNQVLNPTDTYYNNQRQIFAYGGRVYEIGGEVDLDDNELAELAAAGFKLSRV
jgi:hypothetical protein